MTPAQSSLKDELIASIPSLRAFAITLIGDRDRADDLVQDTLVRAWSHLDTFEPGTNLRSWLFTILKNRFYSVLRKYKREVEDADGLLAAKLATPAGQPGHMDLQDFQEALSGLPAEQKMALILVGASGFSHEEAAEICGCAIGTIKSRVNRARNRLASMLAVQSGEDFGPDRTTQSVMGGAGSSSEI
jgi:RNA polymerase sigma-70 factor, ECF subfamily